MALFFLITGEETEPPTVRSAAYGHTARWSWSKELGSSDWSPQFFAPHNSSCCLNAQVSDTLFQKQEMAGGSIAVLPSPLSTPFYFWTFYLGEINHCPISTITSKPMTLLWFPPGHEIFRAYPASPGLFNVPTWPSLIKLRELNITLLLFLFHLLNPVSQVLGILLMHLTNNLLYAIPFQSILYPIII